MIVVNYEPTIMVNLILCTSCPKTNKQTKKKKDIIIGISVSLSKTAALKEKLSFWLNKKENQLYSVIITEVKYF